MLKRLALISSLLTCSVLSPAALAEIDDASCDLTHSTTQGEFYRCVSEAEDGDARSAYQLGLAYLEGTLVDANSAHAWEWIELAAKRGYIDAQLKMGESYSKGIHSVYDPSKAVAWYRKAARLGSIDGALQLADRLSSGGDYPLSLQEAIRWYKYAARQNNHYAALRLAQLYARGKGYDYLSEANKWLSKIPTQTFQVADNLRVDVDQRLLQLHTAAIERADRFE